MDVINSSHEKLTGEYILLKSDTHTRTHSFSLTNALDQQMPSVAFLRHFTEWSGWVAMFPPVCDRIWYRAYQRANMSLQDTQLNTISCIFSSKNQIKYSKTV